MGGVRCEVCDGRWCDGRWCDGSWCDGRWCDGRWCGGLTPHPPGVMVCCSLHGTQCRLHFSSHSVPNAPSITYHSSSPHSTTTPCASCGGSGGGITHILTRPSLLSHHTSLLSHHTHHNSTIKHITTQPSHTSLLSHHIRHNSVATSPTASPTASYPQPHTHSLIPTASSPQPHPHSLILIASYPQPHAHSLIPAALYS